MAPFLAAYFQDKGSTDDERLYAGISSDGNTFTPIGRVPTNGIVRDPSILPPSLAPDGKWRVACTNHGFSTPTPNNTVDIYAGKAIDALDPAPQHVDCSALKTSGTVQWAWAPEWFKDSDGTIYLIISTSTYSDVNTLMANGAFETWALPATNPSLTTWGTPTKIDLGTPSGLGFIDCYVVKRSSTYHAFSKSGSIKMWTATNFPAGPWTLSDVTTTTDAGNAEGPNVTDMGGGRLRLYYDHINVADGQLGYVESTDGFASFGSLSYAVSQDRIRHASIIDLAGEPAPFTVAVGGARAAVAA